MSHTPLRRAQLIAPFGVGAMLVNKNGLSLVTAGLDYWYRGDPSTQKLEEFNVQEWRLAAELGVKHFRLPPDFRTKLHDKLAENTNLRIPFLRFPTWHVCPRCGAMEEVEPDYQEAKICSACAGQSTSTGKSRQIRMNQVPIVAVCEHGHLLDFPFWEWVHRDAAREKKGKQEKCGGKLKFTSSGSPNLSQQKVTCSCDPKTMSRSLDRILESKTVTAEDGSEELVSVLTAHLTGDDNGRYHCAGKRAWFDPLTPPQGCGQQVRGALTSALNVHYADVRSAIYLPRDAAGAVSEKLLAELEEPNVSRFVEDAAQDGALDRAVQRILQVKGHLKGEYGTATLHKALKFLVDPSPLPDPDLLSARPLTPEQAFRRAEQEVLREERGQGELIITPQALETYGLLAPYLERVNLVRKLRETRALVGFTRVTTHVPTDLEFRKALMWREYDPEKHHWLPANVVYGEGIYFELNHNQLKAWETDEVRAYLAPLAEKYDEFARRYGKPEGKVSPRLVLMHTLAHLLINQLTFDCGYASASLRERLYISEDDAPGLLIYTASGDSEGTLGGLVRMGQPQFFERTFREAVKNARWCSNDPVCMEATEHGGQGPNSMNLAACHSCGLIAETSCEEFNTLLDRAVVVRQYTKTDGHQHEALGFFRDLPD